MLRILRHILRLLIALAVVSGTTAELARAAQYVGPMAMAGTPCNMDMSVSPSSDTKPTAPCKAMTPDCIKLMGCTTAAVLPARFVTHEASVRYNTVGYWTVSSEFASLDCEPEPFPPRTT